MKRPPDILTVIPARGGSKGIPKKNVHLVAGKPLLAYTVEQARQSLPLSRTVVSTDDTEVAAVAAAYSAEVIWRPAEISGDTATSESALLHTLDELERREGYVPRLVVFLQCTSPLRRARDIDRAVDTLIREEADSLLSVVTSHAFIWRTVDGAARPINYDFRHRPRRQDRSPEYKENGSIYVFKPWVLRELNNRLGGRIALYVMDESSALDIDTPEDLELCECLMSRLGRSNPSGLEPQ